MALPAHQLTTRWSLIKLLRSVQSPRRRGEPPGLCVESHESVIVSQVRSQLAVSHCERCVRRLHESLTDRHVAPPTSSSDSKRPCCVQYLVVPRGCHCPCIVQSQAKSGRYSASTRPRSPHIIVVWTGSVSPL